MSQNFSNLCQGTQLFKRKHLFDKLPCWLKESVSCKESACNAGDLGSIPRLGRSPGEGNGNPLQYSCLGNPMDRGAGQGAIHGVSKESGTT